MTRTTHAFINRLKGERGRDVTSEVMEKERPDESYRCSNVAHDM
jgi:hypothetical protein